VVAFVLVFAFMALRPAQLNRSLVGHNTLARVSKPMSLRLKKSRESGAQIFAAASGSSEGRAHLAAAFRQGLSEAGFVDRHNIMIEYRWAQGEFDRLPALVVDLVQRQAAVITTPGSARATLAAKAATSSIPIAFSVGLDPVSLTLAVS